MIIKKAICDNCKKEIDKDKWYYSVGDITRQYANDNIGEMLFNRADLCEECYEKIFYIQRGFIHENKYERLEVESEE